MMMNKEFRVALIRAFSLSDFKEPAEPLGIEAIAAVLRLNGIECELFDRELTSFDETVASVIKYKPSLIGISVLMADNAPDAIKLLLKIRQEQYTPCIIGGMFITTSYEQAGALFPKDCKLVAGEGETAILKVCSELTGTIYPAMEKQHLSPNEWPWMYRPRLQEYLDIGAPINMRTSRGCPGRCNFCATPSLPYSLNNWRGRNVNDIADEMQILCDKYTPHAFNFVDDDFGPLSRLEELTDELAKRSLRCALSLQLRAETVCRASNLPHVAEKLRKAGLSRVFIGLESFNEQTLAYFDKKLNPEKSLEAFTVMRASGIAVHIGYILWHPLSTAERVRYEAKRLKDAGFFTTKIVMARLQLFPGSKLQKDNSYRRISMPIDSYCEEVIKKAAPLYTVWLKGALDVPLRYCLSYIDPDGEAPGKVILVEEQLRRLDELAYEILIEPESVSDSLIISTADDVKERLDAIGSPNISPR